MFLKYLKELTLNLTFTRENQLILKTIKDQFLNIQNRAWNQALPKKPKLRIYWTFKEYLRVKNCVEYNLTPSDRSAMAQFRFGILPLNTETRRFWNQPVENRLRTICEFHVIEDECHLLCKCSLYNDLRNDRIRNITDQTPNFVEMDTTTKSKFCFCCSP